MFAVAKIMAHKSPSPVAFFTVATDAWKLWFESAAVIWLRMFKLAQGGAAADREARRMVDEKIDANLMLGWALTPAFMAGASNEVLMRRAIKHYGKRVHANRRRLEGGK